VESQISPIPPDRYGDRFVRFICGITKSREEAERDAIEKLRDHIGAEQDGVKSPVDKVMEKAEKQAERSSQDLAASDSKAPNRDLTTARSPSAERGEPGGFTLPVVEEAVESGSTGGRSNDGSPARHNRGRSDGQRPPPTPPKDDAHSLRSRGSPSPPLMRDSKAASGDGPPTPPSERKAEGKRITRLDMDKELPPPPPLAV
jgi:1-phosphatidylinositol-4-phosphate 5-kinase